MPLYERADFTLEQSIRADVDNCRKDDGVLGPDVPTEMVCQKRCSELSARPTRGLIVTPLYMDKSCCMVSACGLFCSDNYSMRFYRHIHPVLMQDQARRPPPSPETNVIRASTTCRRLLLLSGKPSSGGCASSAHTDVPRRVSTSPRTPSRAVTCRRMQRGTVFLFRA